MNVKLKKLTPTGHKNMINKKIIKEKFNQYKENYSGIGLDRFEKKITTNDLVNAYNTGIDDLQKLFFQTIAEVLEDVAGEEEKVRVVADKDFDIYKEILNKGKNIKRSKILEYAKQLK